MNTAAAAFAAAAVLLACSAAPQADEPRQPPGHPPVPGLPPGHPSLAPPGNQAERPAADPQDVASVEAIVGAYYDAISGAKGEPRDWDRFLSLFMQEARFVRAGAGGNPPTVLAPEQFVAANRTYFERGGYFERSVHERVDAFGGIAQVFSTYESRRRADDPAPYSRGINSFQLISSGGRWWIVTIMWDHERAGGLVIPPEFLPPEGAETGERVESRE
jgi:hypothetical protein